MAAEQQHGPLPDCDPGDHQRHPGDEERPTQIVDGRALQVGGEPNATPDPGATADEVGKAIKGLSKPALVIWGMKDPFLPGKYADQQAEFFDVKNTVKLPESGHWCFQDDPEAVREPLVPFVRERLCA